MNRFSLLGSNRKPSSTFARCTEERSGLGTSRCAGSMIPATLLHSRAARERACCLTVSRDRSTRRPVGAPTASSATASPSTNDGLRVSPQILVVPVLALSAALGLFQLGQPALWIDEAFTWHATTTHGYVRLADELHWLYYTVMKPWVALAGTSEFALRVPSVVGAVVAVALLYGLVRMLFDTNVALVAALLLSVNPFVVKWSQQARSYTILLALAIATTWLLLRALEREKMMRFVAYG